MSDISAPSGASRWCQTLAPGDIVCFAFPLSECGDQDERPKRRPCLVLEVDTHKGERHALLAYGTTSAGQRNRGYEVQVKDRAARASAGLHEPTRFVGARCIHVPLSDLRFVLGGYGTPILGRLNAGGLARMHAVRARMHAERDIAAEYGRSRRDGPQRRRASLYRMDLRRPAEART